MAQEKASSSLPSEHREERRITGRMFRYPKKKGFRSMNPGPPWLENNIGLEERRNNCWYNPYPDSVQPLSGGVRKLTSCQQGGTNFSTPIFWSGEHVKATQTEYSLLFLLLTNLRDRTSSLRILPLATN